MDSKGISKAIKDSVIDVIDHGINLASDNEVIKQRMDIFKEKQ